MDEFVLQFDEDGNLAPKKYTVEIEFESQKDMELFSDFLQSPNFMDKFEDYKEDNDNV